MKKVNFTLTEQLIEKLTKIKKETGMTASEIVRRALDEWIQSRPIQKSTKSKEVYPTEGDDARAS